MTIAGRAAQNTRSREPRLRYNIGMGHRGPILRWVLAVIALAAALYPLRWLHLLCHREVLRLCTLAGLLDPSRGLGGQIMGYNYPRYPEWVHWAASVVSTALVLGSALALVVLVGRRRGTICGRCASVLRIPSGGRCAACGDHFGAAAGEPRPAPSGSRWFRVRRLAAAVTVLVALHMYLDHRHWTVAYWVIDLGECAGMYVPNLSGHINSFRPFHGEGWQAEAWNLAYDHAPWIVTLVGAYAAALGAYWLVSVPLRRMPPFAPPSETVCGRCGYSLWGVRERCPECGLPI